MPAPPRLAPSPLLLLLSLLPLPPLLLLIPNSCLLAQLPLHQALEQQLQASMEQARQLERCVSDQEQQYDCRTAVLDTLIDRWNEAQQETQAPKAWLEAQLKFALRDHYSEDRLAGVFQVDTLLQQAGTTIERALRQPGEAVVTDLIFEQARWQLPAPGSSAAAPPSQRVLRSLLLHAHRSSQWYETDYWYGLEFDQQGRLQSWWVRQQSEALFWGKLTNTLQRNRLLYP